MPRNPKTTEWTLRIDHLEAEDAERVTNIVTIYLKNALKRYIISRETSSEVEKVHYHLYLDFKEPYPKRYFQEELFPKRFPNHSTATQQIVSSPMKSFESYVPYICKEYNIFLQLGFSQSELLTYGRIYNARNKSPKETKKSVDNIIELLRKNETKDNPVTIDSILNAVHGYYVKTRGSVSHYQMYNMVDAVYRQYYPDDSLVKFKDEYYSYKRRQEDA